MAVGKLSESYRKVIGKLSEGYRKVIGKLSEGLWRCHTVCGNATGLVADMVAESVFIGFYDLSGFVSFSQLFSTFLNSSRFLSGFTFCQVLSGFVRFCQVLSSFGEPGLSLVHGELFPVFHLWVVRSTAHLEGASGCLIDH